MKNQHWRFPNRMRQMHPTHTHDGREDNYLGDEFFVGVDASCHCGSEIYAFTSFNVRYTSNKQTL